MSKKNHIKKSKNKYRASSGVSESAVRTFFVRAIAVWLFVLPLIVHIKKVIVPPQMQDLYLTGEMYEFFAYYKAVWLWAGAIVFFISAVVFKLKYKISFKPNKRIGALIAFAVAVLLSFLFSNYKDVAWIGYLDRYEGTLSWLSYCIAAYAVCTFSNSREHNITLVKGIVLSAGVVGAIGTFQFLKMDFFKTEFAKMLMLGKFYAQMGSMLNFTFEEGRTYTTLYNPNYVGSFAVMTLPLAYYMLKASKNIICRVLYALIGLVLILSLIGSKSTGGLIALLVTIALYTFYIVYKFSRNRDKKTKFGMVALFLVVVAALAGVLMANPKVQAAFKHSGNTRLGIGEAELKDNVITLSFNGAGKVAIENFPEGIVIKKDGQIVEPLGSSKGFIYYSVEGAKHTLYIRVQKNSEKTKNHIKEIIVSDKKDMNTIYKFVVYYAEDAYYIGKRKIESEDFAVAVNNVIKNEKIFSFRGFIWNRTLPLIADSFAVGKGADTFAVVYPQIDPIGRIGIYQGNPLMIVDKAHSLFLSLLLSFGALGFAAYLALIVLNFANKNIYFILSLVGFLTAGVVNDSIIVLELIVFIMAGMYQSRLKVNTDDALVENG